MQTTNSYTDIAAAILKGAALRPQTTYGGLYMIEDGVFCSCTNGAAWEGAHGPFTTFKEALKSFDGDMFFADFPCLNNHITACPAQDCTIDSVYIGDDDDSLFAMLNHLNDEHKWSREAIAAFVAGLEVQHAEH